MTDGAHNHDHHDHHHHDQENPINAAGYFDDQAATWDDDPAKVARAARVADATSGAVALGPEVRMLEYGAGTGLVAQALRPLVGPITLAEPSAGMRAVAQSKIDAGTLSDARVCSLDLTADPVPDDQFDLIVTVMVLHHIADPTPVLDGFAKLLAPGGHLCIVDLDHEDGSFHGDGFAGHHGFHRPELVDRLAAAGFSRVRFVDGLNMVKDGVTYPLFLAVAEGEGHHP